VGSGRSWEIASGPGITALGLAAARAVESGTDDRLIDDPFAAAFVDAADTELPMLTEWPKAGTAVSDQHALHLHGSRYTGLRSRFYDDWLVAASSEGVRQIVILGAGLDARAYRISWPPGTVVLEVDQPGVLAFKESVLTELGARDL
jgi:methyltransferase (TIGR00027 family)